MADTANILALSPIPNDSEVAVAPLGTVLPTTATTALGIAFKDLGNVTDDGVVNGVKRDTTKHYNWGGKVVKVTTDRYTETIKVTLYESSPDVLKTVFGASNVTVSSVSGHQVMTVEHSPLQLTHNCFAFTGIDGSRTVRTIIRNGQITEIGDIVMVHNKPTVYELTIDVFETAAGENGVVQYFDYADVLSGS